MYFRILVKFLLTFFVIVTARQSLAAPTIFEAENLLRAILKDPIMSQGMQSAQLKFVEKKSIESGKNTQMELLEYDLTGIKLGSGINKANISSRDKKTFDIDIFLANGDQTVVSKEPDWEKLQPQWDAFVARYWPGLERLNDWHREILRYRPGRGLFIIQYALKDKEAKVFRVMLDIRLSDGKIGGVATSDVRPLLAGQPVLAAPSPETLLESFRQAWAASHAKTPIQGLSFSDKSRDVFPDPLGGARFVYQLNIIAQDDKMQELIINAVYDEKTGTTQIGSVLTQKELDEIHQRPFTTVIDNNPAWSNDGKQLYFSTTRNVEDYPWWQRGSIVQSLAVSQVTGNKAGSLQIVSPIKTQRGDYGLYDAPSPSPSNRYLAGTFGGEDGKLFALDLQQGIFYLPQRDPKWREALAQKWHLPPNQLTGELPWQVKGIVWSSENSVLVSMLFDWPDYDLFLLKHQPTQPPQKWDLLPLNVDRGEAIIPCLARDGKVIGYGHSVPQSRAEIKEDKPKQWQFVVSNFDTATAKLNKGHSFNLSSEPLSIAWDSIRNRWLVVTEKELLWVEEVKGQLQSLPIGQLKWDEKALHITAAAISPQNGEIAIAAELSTPNVYEQSQCVVQGTIFRWDGKTPQVQPIFEPSLNGLPRYKFPNSKNSWAKIVGDVKKLGLGGIVDSTIQ